MVSNGTTTLARSRSKELYRVAKRSYPIFDLLFPRDSRSLRLLCSTILLQAKDVPLPVARVAILLLSEEIFSPAAHFIYLRYAMKRMFLMRCRNAGNLTA